ncbi:MAG: nucleotidyltransferase family protein [Bacteroidales bacterium]|nr:nucleotidyltransferase family protein [Bacteroidales bacterium]
MNKIDKEIHLEKFIVSPEISIAKAIPILDSAGAGILLVCDEDRKLLGIITDGDIRRAILNNISFEGACITIANKDTVLARSDPTPTEALHLMDHSNKFVVNHLPVLDQSGCVVDLIMRRDLVKEDDLGLSAVVMAGGFGTRLYPLTKKLPKPMLPMGDRPLMQVIIEQLRGSGIRKVNISTHYQPEKIIDHFGDGTAFDVDINYVNEKSPMGTAGALGLMENTEEPLLVINGDILTKVDYRAMLDYHREHNADITVAVRQYHMQVPYGVIEGEGEHVRQIREKPNLNFLVNAGIYILEPSARRNIKNGQRLEMTDLIQQLIEDGNTVVSFPIIEYWLDIGQHADYEQAQNDMKNGNYLNKKEDLK